MSMIRDLRAAVRPVRRRPGAPEQPPAPSSAVVDCAVYRDGRRGVRRLTPEEAVEQVRSTGEGFVWLALYEPDERELSGIASLFGLHPLAVEDAVHAHQRPKLERYDDMLFTVFKTVRYVEHDELTPTSEVVDTGEVMVFVGADFVITVRHGHGALRALRHRLESDPELLAKGPSAVLHAIADQTVDDYLAVTDAVQDDIDEVEYAVFAAAEPRAGRGGRRRAGGRPSHDAGRVYQLKRELLELKRATAPLARPLQLLSERPMRLVDPDIQNYFRDVADHLARVTEQVSAFDELLTSILQANLAQVTVAQNEDMRKITSWAAIFAIPTMVAGIYGMNFEHMPELGWRYGYPVVLGAILVACFLVHRGFRRNGWL
ncbi:magnesium and cobalt transport protein CorA [Allostreptomyces psammosilenae]|uniref:Magnesium transporter n=1 Tax=Allostreptomyces psammosilenae TaxID=1892865 RepID=A0A853ACL6_9ACTN|nr:magnesium and cobalt transport protein CorA [Allostreptomyces psammosilenae]NYI08102.1 magnesium transporter [Allostreptomyces psammosilenae]